MLGVAVMTSDLLVNWHGNWGYVSAHPASLLKPYGLPVLTLFGLFVFATALPLRRSFDQTVTSTTGPPVTG